MSKITVTRQHKRDLLTEKSKKPQEKLLNKDFRKPTIGKINDNKKLLSLNKTKKKMEHLEIKTGKEELTLGNRIEDPKATQEEMKTPNITNKSNQFQEVVVHEEISKAISDERLSNKVNTVNHSPSKVPQDIIIVYEEVPSKSNYEKQKEKQKELLDIVTKKTAEYQASKPSSGVFTEVVTHGAFTPKSVTKDLNKTDNIGRSNGSNGHKTLYGFPSSANDLALDAKSDLESDPNISDAVKEKVIDKLFSLVSMVQHVYESKVRVVTEFEKYKETQLKNELRKEKEHSEQLYKLNMNFQNEVVQSIQRLKSELDISRTVSKNMDDDNSSMTMKSSSVDFNTSDDAQDLDTTDINSTDDLIEQRKSECLSDANEDKVNKLS